MTTITADIVALLRSRGEHESRQGDRLLLDAADEIERLRAYANHERSLGAEGPMIELTHAKQEIERLWVVIVKRDAEIARLRTDNARLIETMQQPDQVGYWQRRCEIAEDNTRRLRAALE